MSFSKSTTRSAAGGSSAACTPKPPASSRLATRRKRGDVIMRTQQNAVRERPGQQQEISALACPAPQVRILSAWAARRRHATRPIRQKSPSFEPMKFSPSSPLPLLVWLFASIPLHAAEWQLTVAAGDFNRQHTLVTFSAPAGMRGQFLLREAGGASIPLQVEPDG